MTRQDAERYARWLKQIYHRQSVVRENEDGTFSAYLVASWSPESQGSV